MGGFRPTHPIKHGARNGRHPIKIYKNWKCYFNDNSPNRGKHLWKLGSALVYQIYPDSENRWWFLWCGELEISIDVPENEEYSALDRAEQFLQTQFLVKLEEHQAFADKWNKLLHGEFDAPVDPKP